VRQLNSGVCEGGRKNVDGTVNECGGGGSSWAWAARDGEAVII
jgi:hypothetical protein